MASSCHAHCLAQAHVSFAKRRSSLILLHAAQADLEDPDAPYSAINYGAESFPAFTPLGGGTCNVDLPNDSTLNRYLFVIEYYVSQVGA